MNQARKKTANDFGDKEIQAAFSRLKPGEAITAAGLSELICGQDVVGWGARLASLVTQGYLYRFSESGKTWYCLASDKQNPAANINKLRDPLAIAVLPAIYGRWAGDARCSFDDMGAMAYRIADGAIRARSKQVNE